MKARSLHLLIFSICFILLNACSTTSEIKDGRTAYKLKKYHLAASLLQKDLSKESDREKRMELSVMIAESYLKANFTDQAEKWYAKALDYRFDPDLQLQYGRVLKQNEKYKEAVEAFETYLQEEPYGVAIAKAELAAARKALEWKNQNSNIKIIALDDVNSAAADYAPVIYKDDRLVFTSSRSEATGEMLYDWTGEKFGDLFISNMKENNSFTKPTGFSNSINTSHYEGTVAFSADFKEMYFSYCPPVKEPETSFCRIYYSRFIGGDWSGSELVNIFDDTANLAHPFLTADGSTLWFSTDFEGGYGGKDLYYIKKLKDGQWSLPYNAGSKINTIEDEMFPSIDAEGTLYFASNGHGGFGGLDIFSAKYDTKRKRWTQVKNMKYPINSGADDFALVMEKLKPENEKDPVLSSGYFSSSRSGGKGNDDIYKFIFENINFYSLKGLTLEDEYADPQDPDSEILGESSLSGATIILKNPLNDEIIATTTVDKNGKFSYKLQPNSDYKVVASKNGYFNNSTNVTTKGKGTTDSLEIVIKTQIKLNKIWPEREIVIPNIYYDFNKAALREESKPVLDSLLTLFYENPDVKIEIGSHTDSRGTTDYNDDLSQRRAESVVNYLISNGVSRKQIRPQGYGERKLVNRCIDGVECSEEEHQENRRTTFRVVSANFKLESVKPEEIKVDPKMINPEESEIPNER
ncbi:MAG: OmpA family protein [Chitinophagales bacterium]|nr:OmpA family protein [Chitinophagales bacterium]